MNFVFFCFRDFGVFNIYKTVKLRSHLPTLKMLLCGICGNFSLFNLRDDGFFNICQNMSC
jgi:hypothetical protein